MSTAPPIDEIELTSYQPQNIESPSYVVYLRNASASYGIKFNYVSVFNNLDMTVEKGTIYGLLGASGCGKTTLLNCLLGSKKLDYGRVWVLGGTPKTRNSGVPGSRVGYMPQETALYDSFTVREILIYFGWIAGMKTKDVKERYEFLKELLMLPDRGETIRQLSGGQQRRVSLAAALVHSPELLILDEPTVGLDPIVRATIWNYLTKLTSQNGTTIIITTHYIEEARNANCVALMRGQAFLVEEPPEQLITRYQAASLEEIFLKLSVQQTEQRYMKPTELKSVGCKDKEDQSDATHFQISKRSLPEIPTEVVSCRVADYLPKLNSNHIKALLWKGYIWIIRNLRPMGLIMLLPFFITTLFIYTVGNNPVDLSVAMINYETNNSRNCNSVLSCNNSQLSCSYTTYLEKRGLNLIYYDLENEAINSVIRKDNYAFIVIPHNYTAALHKRIDRGQYTKSWNLNNSEIVVYRDVFNKHISLYIQAYLYQSFQVFIQDYVESCGKKRKVFKIPVNFETPVYGNLKQDFTNYAIPGSVLSIVFIIAVATTSTAMLMERNECSFDRTYVIGITMEELLLSHIIVEYFVTLAQAAITVITSFVIFNMTINGSIFLVYSLTAATGFCGMCYGLLISSVCDREITATLAATGSLLTILILCGLIWPIEAVHPWIKPVVNFIPLTQAGHSLRNILQKGWGIPLVYQGFVSVTIWSVIFLITSLILLKFKK